MENNLSVREKLFELRRRFLPFGYFNFMYQIDENVFICKYKFDGMEKEQEFLNSDIEGLMDELNAILFSYKKVYIPRYVR